MRLSKSRETSTSIIQKLIVVRIAAALVTVPAVCVLTYSRWATPLYRLKLKASGEHRHAFYPRLSIIWSFSPRYDINKRVAKDHRLGDSTCPPGASAEYPAQWHADALISYETGARAETSDPTFGVHASVYYLNWRCTIPKVSQNFLSRRRPGLSCRKMLVHHCSQQVARSCDLHRGGI